MLFSLVMLSSMPAGPDAGDGSEFDISDFAGQIIEIVAEWLIGGIIDVWEAFLDSIVAFFASFGVVGEAAWATLETLGSAVASLLWLLLSIVESLAVGLASSAGPFAPIVSVVVIGVSIVATIWMIRLIISLLIRVFPFA
jgi:hypothetical protein